MKFFLLVVMLAECAAVPRDLSGSMFTFPAETDTAHVRLITSRQGFTAATVCLRFFTDISRGQPLFSLATQTADNAFLIWTTPSAAEDQLWVRNNHAIFWGQSPKMNTWNSVCSTWDSVSGLGQQWLNGNPSVRRHIISGSNIIGPFSIILGQEQDSFGGAFDINQNFKGMISDVHMWDHVLSPSDILYYSDGLNYPPGNTLNWKSLEFQETGRVLLERKFKSFA
ncbi:mucosal pentraxin-like [Genypterus blacodes]|uniref:mucosal pentraxin-like n=1 Tax=Genypterus blacodes TaxID=154954 RepID=UPI003F776D6A